MGLIALKLGANFSKELGLKLLAFVVEDEKVGAEVGGHPSDERTSEEPRVVGEMGVMGDEC